MKQKQQALKISTADSLRIAAEASVDPRTVQRWLRGEALRTLTTERIEAAVQKLGIQAKS